jgi:hypothetical protein
MADSDDELAEKAKKYGWSPSEVAYYKSLRGDIPQAQPSPDTSTAPSPSPARGTTDPAQFQDSKINPQNVDPALAQGIQNGFNQATGMSQGGAVKGVTGGGSVMFGDTVIADHQRPALGYDHAPKYAHGGKVHPQGVPPQVPGLEPAAQQMQMKQDALHKLKEHDRHRVRKPEPKKPK